MKIKFLKLWDLLGYFERTTSERPTYQKLALSGLLIICGKKSQISRDFWGQNRGKIGQFRGNFQGKLGRKAIGKQTTTIHSRKEPMAKPLTSWLVPSFLQHNLRLVVSERCS